MSEISQQEFQRRRQALLAQMQPGSAALILPHRKRRVARTVNTPTAKAVISGTSPVLTNLKPCWC